MNQKRLGVGDYVIAALFAVMIVIVTAQVVARYVLDDSLVWTEELSRHVFVWMTFVGAMLAIKEGTHIRVDIFVGHLPARVQKYLASLYLLLITVFLGVVVFVGFQMVRLTSGQTTSGLDLPLNYALYASLPITAIFGIWLAARRTVTTIRGDSKEGHPEAR